MKGSDKFQVFCAEYDAQVEEMPRSELNARLELLSGLGWRPKVNGTLPGVFPDKSAGNRCGWSVKWTMKGRMLVPEHIYRLEHMTVEQLIAEALDVAYRGQSPELAILLLKHYAGEELNYGHWIIQVKNCLGLARPAYREYIAHWAIGPGDTEGFGRIMQVMPRPEYSSTDALLRSLGVQALGMKV